MTMPTYLASAAPTGGRGEKRATWTREGEAAKAKITHDNTTRGERGRDWRSLVKIKGCKQNIKKYLLEGEYLVLSYTLIRCARKSPNSGTSPKNSFVLLHSIYN